MVGSVFVEPVDGLAEALFEGDFGLPVDEFFGSGDIEAAAGLAVGLGGVPADFFGDGFFGCEAGEFGDEVDEVFDGDFHVGAEVDRGWVVHLFSGCQQSIGAVFDVEELAAC